jgi:hypothetical protein
VCCWRSLLSIPLQGEQLTAESGWHLVEQQIAANSSNKLMTVLNAHTLPQGPDCTTAGKVCMDQCLGRLPSNICTCVAAVTWLYRMRIQQSCSGSTQLRVIVCAVQSCTTCFTVALGCLQVLKHVINQERPDQAQKSDPGMPSSHANSE